MMRCLYCGKRLSVLRQFSGRGFCSADHQARYRHDQESIGLARLIEEKQVHHKTTKNERSSPRAGQPHLTERFFTVMPKPSSDGFPVLAAGNPMRPLDTACLPAAEMNIRKCRMPAGAVLTPGLGQQPGYECIPAKENFSPVVYLEVRVPAPVLESANSCGLQAPAFACLDVSPAMVDSAPELATSEAAPLADGPNEPAVIPRLDTSIRCEMPVAGSAEAPVAIRHTAERLGSAVTGPIDFPPTFDVRIASDSVRFLRPAIEEVLATANVPASMAGFRAFVDAQPPKSSALVAVEPHSAMVQATELAQPASAPFSASGLRALSFVLAPSIGAVGHRGTKPAEASWYVCPPPHAVPRLSAAPNAPGADLRRLTRPADSLQSEDCVPGGEHAAPPAGSGNMAEPVNEATAERAVWPFHGEIEYTAELGHAGAISLPAPSFEAEREPVQPAFLELTGKGFCLPTGRLAVHHPAGLPRCTDPLPIAAEPVSGIEGAPDLQAVEAATSGPKHPAIHRPAVQVRPDCPQFRPVTCPVACEPQPPGAEPDSTPQMERAAPLEMHCQHTASFSSGPATLLDDMPQLARQVMAPQTRLFALGVDNIVPAALERIAPGSLRPIPIVLRPATCRSGLEPDPESPPATLPPESRGIPALARVWQPMAATWRSVPATLKWSVMALPLVGILAYQSQNVPEMVSEAGEREAEVVQASLSNRWENFRENIAGRAAVSLSDDFRSGLGQWEGSGDWAQSWSYDKAGFVMPGGLALYKPSLALQDYHFEFTGQIENGALSWAYRAADTDNYYAAKLMITERGPLPEAELIRYAVVNGKREKAQRTKVPFPLRNGKMYRIHVEVRGTGFTTYVDGQVVDFFRDDRLPAGGVGFFTSRGEKARLRSVSVVHQYDFLGRLCALLAPYNIKTDPRSSFQ